MKGRNLAKITRLECWWPDTIVNTENVKIVMKAVKHSWKIHQRYFFDKWLVSNEGRYRLRFVPAAKQMIVRKNGTEGRTKALTQMFVKFNNPVQHLSRWKSVSKGNHRYTEHDVPRVIRWNDCEGGFTMIPRPFQRKCWSPLLMCL